MGQIRVFFQIQFSTFWLTTNPGNFSHQIQYIVAWHAKMYWIWSEKIRICPIWGQSDTFFVQIWSPSRRSDIGSVKLVNQGTGLTCQFQCQLNWQGQTFVSIILYACPEWNNECIQFTFYFKGFPQIIDGFNDKVIAVYKVISSVILSGSRSRRVGVGE